MLHVKVEWQEAPGVRDSLHRATWGRLEIHASDGEGGVCLTECLSRRGGGLRSGVYGTVFPLASWVVENWWSLLNEGSRIVDGFRSGRDLGQSEAARSWVRRHNLLLGRSGTALPDLSLFRDGDFVVLRASSDPDDAGSPYPVRFLSDRILRLLPQDVEAGLCSLVSVVLERIREADAELFDAPETVEFRENWNAIYSARGAERRLCETAAAMGVDPYDARELSDDLAAIIERDVVNLDQGVRDEFIAATRAEKLEVDLGWLRAASNRVEPMTQMSRMAESRQEPGGRPAHLVGYEAASHVRSRLRMPAEVIEDLETLMEGQGAWDPSLEFEAPMNGVARRLDGLIGRDDRGKFRIVTPSHRRSDDERFLLARGWALTEEPIAAAVSLLSRSSSWVQRASRAFAAEILAPAAALRSRISDTVDSEQIEELATEFMVRREVISRQIENHRLAVLVYT